MRLHVNGFVQIFCRILHRITQQNWAGTIKTNYFFLSDGYIDGGQDCPSNPPPRSANGCNSRPLAVADPGEGPGGPGLSPYYLTKPRPQRPKKFFLRPGLTLSQGLDDRAPPLSQGLDDRAPPLPQGLDDRAPPLSEGLNPPLPCYQNP